MIPESMRARPPINGRAPAVRSAALPLCALLFLIGRASGEDEQFAKRFDTGFAKALIHAGTCTIALRQSDFTYATPYDCTTIVTAYRGQPLDDVPPEAVLARSLIARLQRDLGAVVDCYDEASQPAVARHFTEYLKSDPAKGEDPTHVSAALIAGGFVADALHIGYRFQDRTGAAMVAWEAVLMRSGRGWRLTERTAPDDFPTAFAGACHTAMSAHGELAGDELARMAVCRILMAPTVHAELVQPQDLRLGDLAMAFMISAQEPPLQLAGARDAGSDPALPALRAAYLLYAGQGGAAGIGALWLDGDPASIPASPFAGAAGVPRLRFCHGAFRGDACSIYLLGDGHQATADVMLCAANGSWKLMNRPSAAATDCGLWRMAANIQLWSQVAELMRTHGE